MKLLLLISSERLFEAKYTGIRIHVSTSAAFPWLRPLVYQHTCSPMYNKHKGCVSQSSPTPQTFHFRNAHMHTHNLNLNTRRMQGIVGLN